MGQILGMRFRLAFVLLLLSSPTSAATGADVQTRISTDAESGKPLVAHVVVALADNEHQGIVPIPAKLGDGSSPRTNLYWGALYGVRTHTTRSAGWTLVTESHPTRSGVLERIVLTTTVTRAGKELTLYLVADAYDGSKIREAIDTYLRYAAGHDAEEIVLDDNGYDTTLPSGGASHLVAFVGHNGFLDGFTDRSPESPWPPAHEANRDAEPRSAVALACVSQNDFLEPLRAGGAHPLLLTTGLMAPEAYTLDAVVRTWFGGGTVAAAKESAAVAYDRYQKCGLRGARRLFATYE